MPLQSLKGMSSGPGNIGVYLCAVPLCPKCPVEYKGVSSRCVNPDFLICSSSCTCDPRPKIYIFI